MLENEPSLPISGKCRILIHTLTPGRALQPRHLGVPPWKTALFRNKSWSTQVMFTKYQMSAFKKMDHERMCHWEGMHTVVTAEIPPWRCPIPTDSSGPLGILSLAVISPFQDSLYSAWSQQQASGKLVTGRETSQRARAAVEKEFSHLPFPCSVRIQELGSVLTC